MAYTATIGFFDGVHKGHQYLIEQLLHEAARQGTDSAIITFEEHPENILRGIRKPLLTTYSERTTLLRATGISEIFCFRFDIVKDMTAEDFMRILKNNCHVDVLLMGYDHHFGSDRLCSFADYKAAAERVGMQLCPIQQAPEGDVSSSKIRKALLNGDVEKATKMLGKPYTISGAVVHGRGIGREIGYPTANIEPDRDKLLPRAGVYKVEIEGLEEDGQRNEDRRTAILNIGNNPTISNDSNTTLEVHIPDYDHNLYGRPLTLRFLRYIREERRFDSIAELQQQIAKDLRAMRET